MLRERHQLFRTVLIAADAVFVSAAVVVAYAIRFELLKECPIEFLQPLDAKNATFQSHGIPWVAIPAVLVGLYYAGLYQPRRDQRFVREAWVIFRAMAFGMLIVVSLSFLLRKQFLGKEVDPSRLQLAIFAVISTASLLSWRFSFRTMLRSLRSRGWNLRHVAIIGTGRLAQVVYHTLQRNSWTGIVPAYFISHTDQETRTVIKDAPVLGHIGDVDRILDEHEVAGVFVALPHRMTNEMPRLLSRLERHPIDVRIVPDVNPKYTPFTMATTVLDGMPVLSLRQSPVEGVNRFWKRSLDIFGSIAAIILFAPIMAVIALAVRISGPGPVIFRQPRASLGGRTFLLYKFRTMRHVSREQQAIRDHGKGVEAWTQADDPNITRLGRLLRRTSLDELPQLFNVLLGEMSLVGPRPERPELISRFREDWRGYMLRQHVKAGMTGWAQVNGLRGRTSLRKRLQYDLFYIRHWSLGFDLRILWLTVFRGFVHPNAQ